MRRLLNELLYDLKEPGANILAVPALLLGYILLCTAYHFGIDPGSFAILSSLELLVPFLGGYCALMLMQGLLDTEGCELLLSYPRSNLYWGIFRQFRFSVLFFILVFIVCAWICGLLGLPLGQLYLLSVMQSFAVMAIAFLGVSLTRRVSTGLILLIAFVGIQITLGREFRILNWLFVLTGSLPDPQTLTAIVWRSIVIGLGGWGLGQLWIRSEEKAS